ncbi:MAG: DUF7144 family membrane protein [Thermoplasmatota archaeon]
MSAPFDPHKHVSLNAVLLYVTGSLALFGGLVAFAATFVTAEFLDGQDQSGIAAFWVRFGGMVALSGALFLGVPALAAGVGLSRRQEWGRILALVVAGINALLGLTLFAGNVVALVNAVLAVYAFWSLTRPELIAYLRGEDAQQQQLVVTV